MFAWVHSCVQSCVRVHSGSLGFTQGRLCVAGFFEVRVDSLVRIHFGSLGICLARLVVAVFSAVRLVTFGRAEWSPGSFGFAGVHSGALRVLRTRLSISYETLGSVVCVHSGARRVRRKHSLSRMCRRVHSSFAWVYSSEPSGRRVQSGWCGFIRARLVVAGFIRVRVGSLGGA